MLKKERVYIIMVMMMKFDKFWMRLMKKNKNLDHHNLNIK